MCEMAIDSEPPPVVDTEGGQEQPPAPLNDKIITMEVGNMVNRALFIATKNTSNEARGHGIDLKNKLDDWGWETEIIGPAEASLFNVTAGLDWLDRLGENCLIYFLDHSSFSEQAYILSPAEKFYFSLFGPKIGEIALKYSQEKTLIVCGKHSGTSAVLDHSSFSENGGTIIASMDPNEEGTVDPATNTKYDVFNIAPHLTYPYMYFSAAAEMEKTRILIEYPKPQHVMIKY